MAKKKFLALLFVGLLRHGAARRVAAPKEEAAICPNDQLRYQKHCNASCKTTTLSRRTDSNLNRSFRESCALACSSTDRCECFQISANGKNCRVGVARGNLVKKSRGVAYVTKMDETQLPKEVEASGSLPTPCRKGQKVCKKGECSSYFACGFEGTWETEMCPDGLAFNLARKKCDWPTQVSGCESFVEHELPRIGCGKGEFVLATGHSKAAQSWILSEMDSWLKIVNVKERPEGAAAVKILQATAYRLSSKGGASAPSRWAAFTKESDGSLVMQAVALVEQTGTKVNIMAIVSRRSLMNDELCKSGSGKALLSGILETIHEDYPEDALTMIGTPGDKFVEKLYRSHGMHQYGVEESGMPKLKLDVPAHCVAYVTEKILCKEMGIPDYLALGWRLLPGSQYMYKNCAHMIPSGTYLKEISKMMGVAP